MDTIEAIITTNVDRYGKPLEEHIEEVNKVHASDVAAGAAESMLSDPDLYLENGCTAPCCVAESERRFWRSQRSRM